MRKCLSRRFMTLFGCVIKDDLCWYEGLVSTLWPKNVMACYENLF